ncbi:hypothetical protein EYB45_08555 [Erythrobacteraceae bacterium CFH 75059]|uniref:hypothetical protein n=1 Tax=Qipengyuania thermophila TaxID=2509361 RepID=UPI00101F4693|nr:hypothetical protein [Qipengyuania thermophila]TCD04287.1 hypothetical protein EYB45_08555 [Erythrobacteraceae bacterium CFH 75059]
MLTAWLTAKGLLGIRNGWWTLAALVIATAAATLVTITDNRDRRLADTARDAGAAATTVEQQRSVLEQIERAHHAEMEIDRGGDAGRYERCLRDATHDTRAHCDRFKPVPGGS